MPASAFNATYATGVTPTTPLTVPHGNHIASYATDGSVNNSTLTLDFGDTGFDLSANQIDLMVAFDEVDNTADDASNARLNFTHQFAQIGIEVANLNTQVDVTIQEIEISGIYKSTAGPMVFTCNNSTVTQQWTYTAITQNTVYKVYSLTSKQGRLSKMGSSKNPDYKSMISGLLVFPEENSMKIKVTYTATISDISSESICGKIEIPVEWQAGLNYVYKLQISSPGITFSSSIKPWSTSNISHEFN